MIFSEPNLSNMFLRRIIHPVGQGADENSKKDLHKVIWFFN